MYSPLSFFSVDTILSIETVSVTLILYLGPKDNSFPSLNHLAVMSFVPENLHCRVAGSPSVTSIETALSVIVAGSVINTGIQRLCDLKCKFIGYNIVVFYFIVYTDRIGRQERSLN